MDLGVVYVRQRLYVLFTVGAMFWNITLEAQKDLSVEKLDLDIAQG